MTGTLKSDEFYTFDSTKYTTPPKNMSLAKKLRSSVFKKGIVFSLI